MDEVRSVVARVFPDRTVADATPVPRGNRKRTFVVAFDDGTKVVVQLSDRPTALVTETAVARAVRERTTVPVPEILGAGRIGDVGYAVVELAPGRDLHERFVDLADATQRRVARTFGRYLAELHDAFAFDAYGEVVAVEEASGVGTDGGTVVAADTFRATGTGDWPTWFREYVADGVAALPPSLASIGERVRLAVADAALPVAPPAHLYPWDFRPGNALIGDGEVTALLDWGQPLAAAPGLSVAKAEHLVADWYLADGRRLGESFREGYAAVRPYPEVCRAYRLAAVVRSAVDSKGEVTRPGYPERAGEAAVAFHRERLRAHLPD
jgi:hypothetical protein